MKTFASLIAGASAIQLNANLKAAVTDFVMESHQDYYDYNEIMDLQDNIEDQWEIVVKLNDEQLDIIAAEVANIKEIAAYEDLDEDASDWEKFAKDT